MKLQFKCETCIKVWLCSEVYNMILIRVTHLDSCFIHGGVTETSGAEHVRVLQCELGAADMFLYGADCSGQSAAAAAAAASDRLDWFITAHMWTWSMCWSVTPSSLYKHIHPQQASHTGANLVTDESTSWLYHWIPWQLIAWRRKQNRTPIINPTNLKSSPWWALCSQHPTSMDAFMELKGICVEFGVD